MARRFELSGRVVDLDAGTVDGVERLRPIEVRLLRYLSDRPGQVVPHAVLLQHVWGYSPKTRSRTLYSTVHRLRASLERDVAQPRHLLTVPGVGVMLADLRPDPAGRPESSLIGRTPELAALAAGGPGVMALVGPPGVGKSAVATAYAESRGAELVDLARARRLAERGAAPVVVVDDVDALLDAAAEVRRWSAQAPSTQWVVVARAPLSGVRSVRIAPLGAAGVELLVRRVRAIDGSFDPAPVREALHAVSDGVDGLPLALELLAPQIVSLGAIEVARSVADGDWLSAPDEPTRQLRAELGSLIERMDPVVRDVLRQLTVFARSFTLTSAARVVALPVGAPPLRSVVAALVDAGVVMAAGPTERPRFAVLRAMRAWCGHRDPAVEERHAAEYATSLREKFGRDPLPVVGPADLDELDEVCAAADVALRTSTDPRWAELLGWALELLSVAVRRSEYRSLVERAWASPLSEPARVWVGLHRTFWVFGQVRVEEAMAVYRQVAADAERLGMLAVAASLHARFASVSSNAGDEVGVEAALAAARASLARIVDPIPRLVAELEARIEKVRGSSLPADDASEVFGRAVEHAAASGRPGLVNSLRVDLAHALVRAERYEEALTQAEITLADAPEARSRLMGLLRVAEAQLGLRWFDEASETIDRLEGLASRETLPLSGLYARVARVSLWCETGAFDEARARVDALEREVVRSRHVALRAEVLSARAVIARRSGDPAAAGMLWEALGGVGDGAHRRRVAIELLELGTADAAVVLDPLAAVPGERDRATLLRAEWLRSQGLRREAHQLLAAGPTGRNPVIRSAFALACVAAASELGEPPAALPSSGGPDPRWTAVLRHRVARVTGQPTVGSDLSTLEVRPWERRLVDAVRELTATEPSSQSPRFAGSSLG
ncbi:MAG: winged helix-turn-helix domain-containing protein [Myxococcota bacterium]